MECSQRRPVSRYRKTEVTTLPVAPAIRVGGTEPTDEDPLALAIRARGRMVDRDVSPITPSRAVPLPTGAPPRSAADISHSADRPQQVQQEIQKLEESIRNAKLNPNIASPAKVTEPSQPLPSTAPGQVQQEIILIEARLRPSRTELHRMQGKILANRQGLTADQGSPETTPCLLYTSPSPRDRTRSRMPSSA